MRDHCVVMVHMSAVCSNEHPSPSHHPHRCGGSFMSYPRFKLRALAVVGCVAAALAAAACSSSGAGRSSSSGVVAVAVVSNPLITGQMIPLAQANFQKQYPGRKVKFATYT